MTTSISHLQIDNLTVAYKWIGEPSPAPLIFLHGLGDSAIMTFQRIATHPAIGERPSLLIDLPGFGYSTAPDDWPATIERHADIVIGVIDALRVEHAAIVGHSMGGSLALMVAGQRPRAIRQLILAEPLLRREDSTLGKAIAKRREADFIARGYDMLILATRRQAARGDVAAGGFLGPLQHASPAILHRGATSLLAERSPSFLELLHTVPMRRTLLIGERTNVEMGFVPDEVRIVRIPEAGHSMMSENPEAYAVAIGEALEDGTNANALNERGQGYGDERS